MSCRLPLHHSSWKKEHDAFIAAAVCGPDNWHGEDEIDIDEVTGADKQDPVTLMSHCHMQESCIKVTLTQQRGVKRLFSPDTSNECLL